MQAAAKQGASNEINTLLGRGSSFEGKLTFEGTVRIDGKFKGEVFSDDVLVIGEHFTFEPTVDANGSFERELALERRTATEQGRDFTRRRLSRSCLHHGRRSLDQKMVPTHDEMSKKMNASAFSCADSGVVEHPFGNA